MCQLIMEVSTNRSTLTRCRISPTTGSPHDVHDISRRTTSLRLLRPGAGRPQRARPRERLARPISRRPQAQICAMGILRQVARRPGQKASLRQIRAPALIVARASRVDQSPRNIGQYVVVCNKQSVVQALSARCQIESLGGFNKLASNSITSH